MISMEAKKYPQIGTWHGLTVTGKVNAEIFDEQKRSVIEDMRVFTDTGHELTNWLTSKQFEQIERETLGYIAQG